MRGLTMLRAVSHLSVFLLLLLVPVLALPLSTESDLLNSDSFSTSTSSSMWLVEFFSPYCPHCKRFKPTWENLVSLHGHLADSSGFNFARVNCIEQGDLCNKESIKGYPTIMLYRDGQVHKEFQGDRTFERLSEFILANAADYRTYKHEQKEAAAAAAAAAAVAPAGGAPLR